MMKIVFARIPLRDIIVLQVSKSLKDGKSHFSDLQVVKYPSPTGKER